MDCTRITSSKSLTLVDIPESIQRADLERRLPLRSGRFVDHTGERSGSLAVVGFAGFIDGYAAWLMRCDCGRFTVVRTNHLAATRSCGCCSGQDGSGLRYHPLYRTWRGIIDRCFDKNCRSYKHYGARGITMCERWRTSCAAFIEDMGPKPSPSHSIDRIDNDGNYEPSNCRWATPKDQRANQRPSRLRRKTMLTAYGITRPVAEWSRVLGVTNQAIYARMKRCKERGLDLSEALKIPSRTA